MLVDGFDQKLIFYHDLRHLGLNFTNASVKKRIELLHADIALLLLIQQRHHLDPGIKVFALFFQKSSKTLDIDNTLITVVTQVHIGSIDFILGIVLVIRRYKGCVLDDVVFVFVDGGFGQLLLRDVVLTVQFSQHLFVCVLGCAVATWDLLV
jgi:hypothetical protein